MTPEDILGGISFLFDRQNKRLYTSEYDHGTMLAKIPLQKGRRTQLYHDYFENDKFFEKEFFAGRVTDNFDAVVFHHPSQYEDSDDLTDCLWSLERRGILRPGADMYFSLDPNKYTVKVGLTVMAYIILLKVESII